MNIQCDQKENKSEQALPIIGHVVARNSMEISVQCTGVDNLWSQMPLIPHETVELQLCILLLLPDNGENL
jgi:hypothetical protein